MGRKRENGQMDNFQQISCLAEESFFLGEEKANAHTKREYPESRGINQSEHFFME